MQILHEELEASGCRRIGFEDSSQLMFGRGGFAVLVRRVARYEVIHDDEATVETVPSPETLSPLALLHSSASDDLETSNGDVASTVVEWPDAWPVLSGGSAPMVRAWSLPALMEPRASGMRPQASGWAPHSRIRQRC